MRTIKIRVWDVKNNGWVYTVPGNSDDHNVLGTVYFEDLYQDENDYIWEQYTGLKDKNGKEIYEGDIVKLYDGRRLVSMCIISYDELNGEYIWSNDLDNTPLYGGFPVWAKYLIVGNIHENPELLGGEE